jgi:hypothetical protein
MLILVVMLPVLALVVVAMLLALMPAGLRATAKLALAPR